MRGIIDLARRCVRCGFCLDACPTYRLTGRESVSPRGRIHLMRAVAEGATPLRDDLIRYIDSCLGCRACETACPSAVEYGRIVETFRARIEASSVRPIVQSTAKRQLVRMMSTPGLLAASLIASRGADPLLGTQRHLPRPVAQALLGNHGTRVMMPATPDRIAVGTAPDISPATTERRYTVVLLQGCAMRALYHSTNLATIRVLQRAGCDVLCPPELGCCGALDFHAGLRGDGLAKARAAIDVLVDMRYDALVTNSAGCGSTLREYGTLLAEDPSYSGAAQNLASKVRDVSEFLCEIGFPKLEGSFDASVAYHDACHLAHAQRVTEAPRRLLSSVPGLRLIDLPESDMCCGSAGTYNVLQPTMASRLLRRKVDNIASVDPDVVAMGNPGCMAWIQRGLDERGLRTRAMHVIDIVDAALDDPAQARRTPVDTA